jgi:excisionase family DNA binding protein
MPTEIEGIKFYTIQETAQALRVTPQTIRAYIKQGRINSQRIGKPIFITDSNLRDFLTVPKVKPMNQDKIISKIEANSPATGKITLNNCKKTLAIKKLACHLYYRRTIQDEEKKVQEYCYTRNIDEALTDSLRYGSIFFRVGEPDNWSKQYQVVNEEKGEPV